MAGYQLTQGQMDAIREVVRHYFAMFRHEDPKKNRTQVQRNLQVLLEEDLFAAGDVKDDPSEASAVVLAKRNGKLVNTGRRITIVNRFENISVDAGTYAKAEWIDGEWQLYAADCAPESTSVDSGSHGDIEPSPSIGGP